jgi:hypothetical protein
MFFPKTRYHYVPPCPRCGSKKTGRFIYMVNINNADKVISSRMIKGELVQIVTGISETKYENAYCDECGCEWHANIDILFLDKEKINKEMVARGITKEKYKNIANIKKNTKKKLQEERKQRKKEMKNKKKKRKQNLK